MKLMYKSTVRFAPQSSPLGTTPEFAERTGRRRQRRDDQNRRMQKRKGEPSADRRERAAGRARGPSPERAWACGRSVYP